MRALREAQSEVLDAVPALEARRVGIREALGLVLVEDVTARHDLPPFANSAMDGYAVRSVDVRDAPVALPVVDEVAAGAVATHEVGPGSAIKIMTGAPMPRGADAVVKVEDTESAGPDRVRILTAVDAGTALRLAGGDVAEGTTVLRRGERLRPPHLGVLAALGEAYPLVSKRPVVSIMSTGDEIVPPETKELGPGKIRDSNRFLLRGLLEELGAVVIDHGIVRDDSVSLSRVLNHAARESDVIVTSGGVSMGEYDVVKEVFAGMGNVDFWRVAMQPGKAVWVRIVGGSAVLWTSREPGLGCCRLRAVPSSRSIEDDGCFHTVSPPGGGHDGRVGCDRPGEGRVPAHARAVRVGSMVGCAQRRSIIKRSQRVGRGQCIWSRTGGSG